MAAPRNPEDAIIPLFKNHAIQNPAKTKEAGRPIFDDMEVCEIRIAGSRNIGVYPATAISFWREDPITGESSPVTYAERFSRQYRQFKEMAVQTKSGTPLAHAPFLTEARRAELRALNIYTIEALAQIDGQELKNLGSNGRSLKNQAEEYMASSRVGAPNLAIAAELEEMKAKNAILEEDVAKLKAERESAQAKAAEAAADPFEGMSLEQLRDFIKTNTGHAPHGSLNRKTLVRMATEAQQKAA